MNRWNHHLLSTVSARPQWLTLKNGAQSYIDAVMKGFPPNHIFLSTPVASISHSSTNKPILKLQNGTSATYDHVILACHGDQALDLLSSPTAIEEAIMSGFQTSKNTAILHSDLSLMPKSRKAWSSWNYMTKSNPYGKGDIDQVCLTYNMNILQHLPEEVFGHVLVTLNPLHLPPPDLVQGRYTYSHPLYNATSIKSQSLLPQIQNKRGISYCGAWTKYGFHEDGFSSGLKVAQDHLGAKIPFQFRDSTYSRGRQPVLKTADLALRLWISWVQLFIVLLERMIVAVKGQQARIKGQLKIGKMKAKKLV